MSLHTFVPTSLRLRPYVGFQSVPSMQNVLQGSYEYKFSWSLVWFYSLCFRCRPLSTRQKICRDAQRHPNIVLFLNVVSCHRETGQVICERVATRRTWNIKTHDFIACLKSSQIKGLKFGFKVGHYVDFLERINKK